MQVNHDELIPFQKDKIVLQLHSTSNNSKNGLTSTDHEDELNFSPAPEKHPLDNEVCII